MHLRTSLVPVGLAAVVLALLASGLLLSPLGRTTFAVGGSPKIGAGGQDGPNASDSRLQGAYRFAQDGWVYIHLEGAPAQIGFQHGYLLAPEIADAFAAVKLSITHRTKRDWEFFRRAGREMLWPKIDAEYQEELGGIAEGLKAKGVAIHLDDVVALNAFEELADYYVPWYNAHQQVASAPGQSRQL